jgi:hypothetical protein
MRTNTILVIVSLLSLIALILPSILFLAGSMPLTTTKWVMLAATVVWFVAATPWMWKQSG